MNEREKELYQDKIYLGELAKRFLDKDLARLIVTKAHEEIEAAIDEFLNLDPHDYKRVTDIQVRIRTALSGPQWLNEAVTEGAKALDEYMQRKDTEKEQQEES